jgi:6-phosphofructo-2-kinase
MEKIGRGKTHISRRLGRYLSFFHAVPVEVYHVADYRRRICGALKDAEWFDPANEEASHLRDDCQTAAINDMIQFLNLHSNGVAILDSTNSTLDRRSRLVNMVLFVDFLFLYERSLFFKLDKIHWREGDVD